ncbi:MAG: GTP cyclohydrolase FolE2 [Verrucomicrobia subdivision 3 bacterium]|nr:GTP cyclohydrolase FolE2 [Limisphaerales bacterium]MCS1416405.1 GTP cyclohydrolase FolE2 [Limisphaerales bacterium]
MPPISENRGLTANHSFELHDLQSETDDRAITIDKVGIRGLEIPISVHDRDGDCQKTIARVGMFVDLPHNVRGTHMSRFVAILNEHDAGYSPEGVSRLLAAMQTRLGAHSAHLEVTFPFFVRKAAPTTRITSLMNYQVRILANRIHETLDLILEVQVPVKTLCPCSKSISKYGAHSQRSVVTIQTRSQSTVWVRDLIEIVEASCSSELYAFLKRPDEKHVTESAYENPVFVEDLARNVVLRLQQNNRITWYQVEAENQESIHNHNAYALIRHCPPENRS